MKKFGLIIIISLMVSKSVLAQTSVLSTKARVGNFCSLQAGAVNFGSYNPADLDPLTANLSVSILCNKNTAYSLVIKAYFNGRWNNTSVSKYGKVDASMKFNNKSLYFQLFNEISGTWEDDMNGAGVGTAFKGVGEGVSKEYLFKYRIPSGQYVAPGNYQGGQTIDITF